MPLMCFIHKQRNNTQFIYAPTVNLLLKRISAVIIWPVNSVLMNSVGYVWVNILAIIIKPGIFVVAYVITYYLLVVPGALNYQTKPWRYITFLRFFFMIPRLILTIILGIILLIWVSFIFPSEVLVKCCGR